MNYPAALEMSTKARSNDKTQNPVGWLREYARSLVKSKAEGSTRPSQAISKTKPGYRLGDAVHHSGFGTGRVMAHWPDGTLLVRFDREVKSQLVWPSLLDRLNGRQR